MKIFYKNKILISNQQNKILSNADTFCLLPFYYRLVKFCCCLVAYYFEKSGFFLSKKWVFCMKKVGFFKIKCDKAEYILKKADGTYDKAYILWTLFICL